MTDYQGSEQHDGQAPPPMVKFGPKGHQELTIEVASMVLTLWKEKQPAVFGKYLAEVMTGTAPTGGRS